MVRTIHIKNKVTETVKILLSVVTQNRCTLKLVRDGSFGSVSVQSLLGYPAGQLHGGEMIGNIIPKQQLASMEHQQQQTNFSIMV